MTDRGVMCIFEMHDYFFFIYFQDAESFYLLADWLLYTRNCDVETSHTPSIWYPYPGWNMYGKEDRQTGVQTQK